MLYVICWLLTAVVGAIIGNIKGRPSAGAFWGLLLGPLGWILMVCVPDQRPRCPECLGTVLTGAHKCKHCGSTLEESAEVRINSRYASAIVNHSWSQVFATIIIVPLLFIVAYGNWRSREDREAVRQEYLKIAERLESEVRTITMEQYNALRPGISYRQACDLLGRLGTETARTKFGSDGETICYTWQNDDASNMLLTFQNDRLVERAQFGLH
jgi:hypothetical protein